MALSTVSWKILIMIFTLWINVIVCGSTSTTKDTLPQCNEKNRGMHRLYSNRMGNDQTLICSKQDHVYRWKFLDGSQTYGESFNPAEDCSDIVDSVQNAEDGFYWVLLKNDTPQKVWCDVRTDGGGFMLVGMKNSPISWTVPSNCRPVNPKGPPHWSSAFGNVKVQDFGIQVSSSINFDKTQAHWLYRLNPKRELGNLFTANKGGCTSIHPGIGNVAHVKDILTDSVVTTKFRCSKFGPHTHPKLGWGRMNYCLRNECKNGYAVIHGFLSSAYDHFGSFSYSAVSTSSGIGQNSTAFVGCDHGKCCACFGPKGGRKNYCGRKCTAINGGTVTKKAFVWFWVRSSTPKRVWKRCMEFKMKSAEGKIEKYFVDPTSGIAHKGSCSYQFKTFFNEGTLFVANKQSLQNIPPVPGLLSYRADNKQLYVSEGSRWEALSGETEVQEFEKEVKEKFESQEKTIKDLLSRLDAQVSCSALRRIKPSLRSGFYKINPQGLSFSPFKVYCDMTSKNGAGVTTVGHDSEGATKVQGCEPRGCYKRRIKYNVSMEQIAAVIKTSQRCEQFIKYQCHGSVIRVRTSPYAWWVSRQGAKMKYWGGAAVNSGKCACGMTKSCAGGNSCNCDRNDNVLREDSGFLTDKNSLPVTELRFGDTGDSGEYGYHTLGKLLCWG